ncbi:uncharacterized protein A4U43_C02F7490 [Asparagus officinalis]|uniref:Uncharacterized protein n=1 Tax=Asparagus officinalis TaxID=4686 RepID=A0A5P1FGP2_ASPOF|nr:uncharacterized protein A4U43_C02F7490 [Asparagus officinalis]
MKRNTNYTNPPHPKPSTTQTLIWSNPAYDEPDEQSSVASNDPSVDHDHRMNDPSSSISLSSSCIEPMMCDEEIRLREELGREIERELERELMHEIRVLVRRLSDLKVKQFLRELDNYSRILRDDEKLKKKKWDENGVRKQNNSFDDDDDECSDAESSTAPEVMKHERGWQWRERF